MTLKLYNLLPHPTVQASSELGQDCCFRQDKSGELQTAFVTVTTEKAFPLLPLVTEGISVINKVLNFKILPIVWVLGKQVVAVIATEVIKLLLSYQLCFTGVTSHLKSEEKAISDIAGRHTFLPL